jgi:hypothetical protein
VYRSSFLPPLTAFLVMYSDSLLCFVLIRSQAPAFRALEVLDLVGSIDLFSNFVVSRGAEFIACATYRRFAVRGLAVLFVFVGVLLAWLCEACGCPCVVRLDPRGVPPVRACVVRPCGLLRFARCAIAPYARGLLKSGSLNCSLFLSAAWRGADRRGHDGRHHVHRGNGQPYSSSNGVDQSFVIAAVRGSCTYLSPLNGAFVLSSSGCPGLLHPFRASSPVPPPPLSDSDPDPRYFLGRCRCHNRRQVPQEPVRFWLFHILSFLQAADAVAMLCFRLFVLQP